MPRDLGRWDRILLSLNVSLLSRFRVIVTPKDSLLCFRLLTEEFSVGGSNVGLVEDRPGSSWITIDIEIVPPCKRLRMTVVSFY